MISANMSEQLLKKITKMEDIHAIANLQGRYIYYLQSHKYDKIVKMFSQRADVSVEMDDLGRFIGFEKVSAVFLNVLKPLYMTQGALGLHMLSTPVIEVDDDNQTGFGMWHSFGCNTQPDMVSGRENAELIAIWQQGKYYSDFIKEDGVWKYLHFRWYTNFRTPFDKGWVKQPVVGNLSLVKTIFKNCPEPDYPAEYAPFDPNGLSIFSPLPPDK